MRQHFISAFSRAKTFYTSHERAIVIFALVSGFIIDNLTLRRIDLLFENLVFIFYLVLGGCAILFINYYDSQNSLGKVQSRPRDWARLASPVLLQFAFGGLFSAFFVFYFRSASVGASWPFILFLLAMLIGNEIFAHKFSELTFQVSVYFVVLLSYLIFFVPIVLGRLSPFVFILSLILSAGLIHYFLRLVRRVHGENFEINRRYIYISIISILSGITILYFLNIIPPIPLSVKEKVVAYDVTRLPSGDYQVTTLDKKWYKRLSGDIYYINTGSPLYVFSSVFAPTRLNTPIVHEWQVKEAGKWVTADRTTFAIEGGASGGYRGYTFKQNLYPGQWRVNIETERGATIGRIKFEIKQGGIPADLEEKIY
jgi:hypothetical protein